MLNYFHILVTRIRGNLKAAAKTNRGRAVERSKVLRKYTESTKSRVILCEVRLLTKI